MAPSEVKERLVRRFGLGTRKELREALYDRLARLVESEGDEALHVIASVAADAEGKRQPDRYFAKVVIVRLIERGILPAPAL